MQFTTLTNEEKKKYCDMLFLHLESASQIKDWAWLFLGLELPLEMTDPDSTTTPLDAIWQIYKAFKENTGDVTPGYILLSCREGMKTISVAILETLLLLHFQLDIAHAAAIEAQSAVGLGYVNEFFMRLKPLLEFAGWKDLTANKRTLKFATPQGKTPYIKVLVCTVKGMNSLHVNALFLDELDLADPKALKQAQNIVSHSKGINGIMVYLSTRKYAFGNMNSAIESAAEKNYTILKWNILDVTQACPPSRYLPDEPKEDRWVANNLPLRQITDEEYRLLPDPEKHKWSLVKDAHQGCLTCPLLPVCKKRLSEKPQSATGGFYKPITSVINSFKKNDPDVAESELMCWKPGTEGLVYPRFQSQLGKGNVIDYKTAYETLTGEPCKLTWVSEITLLDLMFRLQIPFFAGVDWGYTHDFVIVIMAMLPNGEVWLMETFASPGLEFADQLLIGMSFRDKYKVQTWFCDPAAPSHLKSFTRNGMKSPKFTKDVLAGIEATRSKIVDGVGRRMFKVLTHHTNQKTITALMKHRFLLDGQANLTMTPDDDRGVADICDTIRYIGQNKWPVKGTQRPNASWTETEQFAMLQNPTVTEQMKNEIASRIADEGGTMRNETSKKGGFHWNF
jgi:hypothetical protein